MAFFVLAIPAAITSAAELLAASWTGVVLAGEALDAYEKYWESDNFRDEITNRINKILANRGLQLKFRNVFDDEMVVDDLDLFAVERINARMKTDFKSLVRLTPDIFMSDAGAVVAGRINVKTGSKITTVWPLETLKEELKSEVLRQFDNRGRYTGGALFKADTLAKIRSKIIAKNPAMLEAVKKVTPHSPKNEAERIRREKAAARQRLYARDHQQVWVPKW